MIIITVHGTGDSEPGCECKKKWWEPGSAFLRKLDAAAHADIMFAPHVWSGANSEAERRKAAESLLKKVLAYEENGETYLLVGHSHGGSVIHTMLRFAASRAIELPRLKRWITIGTPFIRFELKPAWFLRSGPAGRAVIAIVAILTGLFGLALFQVIESNFSSTLALVATASYAIFVAASVTLAARFAQKRILALYSMATKQRMKSFYALKWTSLWDDHDEAINGLVAATKFRGSVRLRDLIRGPIRSIGMALFLFSAFGPFFFRWEPSLCGADHDNLGVVFTAFKLLKPVECLFWGGPLQNIPPKDFTLWYLIKFTALALAPIPLLLIAVLGAYWLTDNLAGKARRCASETVQRHH